LLRRRCGHHFTFAVSDVPGSVGTLSLFDTPGSASWIQDTPDNVFSLAQQDTMTPYETPTSQTGFFLKLNLPSAEALQNAQRLLADHGMLELVGREAGSPSGTPTRPGLGGSRDGLSMIGSRHH
jgi:hypothetical protein